MNFNSLFFPAPLKTYSYITYQNELLYIPKNITQNARTIVTYIPCLFIKYKHKKPTASALGQMTQEQFEHQHFASHKILLYFHGNAEDLGHSYEFLNQISSKFHLNILAMEYPGYGIYRNEEADSETIQMNAQKVFDFVTLNLKFDPKDIILFGRSMGSGPACHLASLSKPSCLILLSPYTSLKAAVRSLLGVVASLLVRERFVNSEVITRVLCPTLIIHGQADTLIPFSHSQLLHASCGGPSKLIIPKNMTHNEFNMTKDLFQPMKQFFIESNILTSLVKGSVAPLKDKYFYPPKIIREMGTESEKRLLEIKLKRNKSTPNLSNSIAFIKQVEEGSPEISHERKQVIHINDGIKTARHNKKETYVNLRQLSTRNLLKQHTQKFGGQAYKGVDVDTEIKSDKSPRSLQVKMQTTLFDRCQKDMHQLRK